MWPRSELSLANTVVSDFAPDNGNAPVSIAGQRARFDLVRSARTAGANCLAQASAEVRIRSEGTVDVMDVSVQGLPPKTGFDVFVTQVPNAPFGLARYQGEIETNQYGRGHQTFIGRFNEESFIVAPGSAPAPQEHHNAFADAQLNPPTGPVHTLHLGLWFDSPADAAKTGCPGDVTPLMAGTTPASRRSAPATSSMLRGRCATCALEDVGVHRTAAAADNRGFGGPRGRCWSRRGLVR